MKTSVITCAAWVPQGQAQANPEKVEISVDDLKKIIEDTQAKLEDVNLSEKSSSNDMDEATTSSSGSQKAAKDNVTLKDDTEEGWEDEESLEDDTNEDSMEVDEEKENRVEKEIKKDQKIKNIDEEEDLDKLYEFDKYDEEEENNLGQLAALSRLTIFADPSEDPLLEDNAARKEDEISESENHIILPTDNLIAVGHVEEDAAILEVYVYNESGNALYVHHDNLLPTIPICMEWLNYNPATDKPGNLVAVGTMGPEIEVWDLDLIDGLEPAFKLGAPKQKEGKKVKKGVKKVNRGKAYGHTDAVLALAWNKEFEHVLASGSADKRIILWDLQELSVSKIFRCCKGQVQCMQWHPTNGSTLVAGSSEGDVHVINCVDGNVTTWQLEGELERVLWTSDGGRDCLLVSSDTGALTCIDISKPKPVWTFKPHEQGCTGLQLSSSCPGLLVTGSEDGKVRVWDVASPSASGGTNTLLSGLPVLVVELEPQVGKIFCLSAALEQPFVFCIGGDQGDNCFKVWDIRASKRVRQVFCPRLGLPVDNDEADNTKLKQQVEDREDVETRFMGSNRGSNQEPREGGARLSGANRQPFSSGRVEKSYRKN